MRLPMAGVVLLAALPAFAQGVESHWYRMCIGSRRP